MEKNARRKFFNKVVRERSWYETATIVPSAVRGIRTKSKPQLKGKKQQITIVGGK